MHAPGNARQAPRRDTAARSLPTGTPLPPRDAYVAALQRSVGNRAVGRLAAARGRTLARKEVGSPSDLRGPQDWLRTDRVRNTQRWQDACLHNLTRADSGQYERIDQRRDFYRWFYEYTAARGWETRWALAAYIVANGAFPIAYMDDDFA